MSTSNPRDPWMSATGTEPIIVVRDETVVESDRPVVVPDALDETPPLLRRPWTMDPIVGIAAVVFLVLLLAVIALYVRELGPDLRATGREVTSPVTDTIEPDTDVSRALSLAAPTDMRTHTINVSGDQDLLALATTAGAVDSFGGASVTADGVEVTQILGERAFEVANPSGATMVVYLPYGEPDDVFVTVGQELTFVGSVSPTSEDLTAIADAGAATAAAGQGAYIIAVPESVHIVEPSAADAAQA